MSDNVENIDNVITIIDNYTDHIRSVSSGFLKNVEMITCNWSQIYISESNCYEQYFHQIVNDDVFIDASNKYYSAFDVSKWVEWHKELLDDEKTHKEDGHNFNIFLFLRDEFGFAVQETMHSKLIKFLLDTYASHGQGNIFLIEFLELLEVENPKEGIWYVSAEQGRIDVLLKRNEPQSIIIIENKSNWADDQDNQLYRYWHQEIYNTTKETEKDFYVSNKYKYQIVYLPPNEGKKYEEQSITKPTDWTENYLPKKLPIEIKTLYFNAFIQEWLENCKKQLPKTNHRIREYINQYQLLCNNL